MIKIAPSILSADFSRLGEQIAEAAAAGADYVHVDVMDGHFVQNITIGPVVVEWIRAATTLPLDVHLMILNPERYVADFARAGADILTVHAEATAHLHGIVQSIKKLGVRAGVAINPATPLSALEEILPDLDLAVIMSVNPGFGGQSFIEGAVSKIARLRAQLDALRLQTEIEVDGGINAEIAPRVAQAGARILVAGSAVYSKKEPVADAIARLRANLAEF
ncbi:MAG: ribulose-phosphate 3-epimerase [Chloroflexota bacterium]|nr:MAG: ribulose-phosphate 3-epimerase [Chloroflexota bacterium]